MKIMNTLLCFVTLAQAAVKVEALYPDNCDKDNATKEDPYHPCVSSSCCTFKQRKSDNELKRCMNDSDRYGVSTGIYKVSSTIMYRWSCPLHDENRTGSS